jgi:hypothetical protein
MGSSPDAGLLIFAKLTLEIQETVPKRWLVKIVFQLDFS